MPTKDSSILSLRIRNPILRQAQAIADKQNISLHAWAIKMIELGIKGGETAEKK